MESRRLRRRPAALGVRQESASAWVVPEVVLTSMQPACPTWKNHSAGQGGAPSTDGVASEVDAGADQPREEAAANDAGASDVMSDDEVADSSEDEDPMCAEFEANYETELTLQRTCTPGGGADQCGDFINIAPGCECTVHITPKDPFAIENLLNLQQLWFNRDCTADCPDVCPMGQEGVCGGDGTCGGS
jgi:hypothetical protein